MEKIRDIINAQLHKMGGDSEKIASEINAEIETKVNPINFEEELYKAFGQVKDISLCMRIAARFYEMGANAQKQQMMKEMVITSYDQKDIMDGDVKHVLYDRYQLITIVLDKVSNIHIGDKVKLIIKKED